MTLAQNQAQQLSLILFSSAYDTEMLYWNHNKWKEDVKAAQWKIDRLTSHENRVNQQSHFVHGRFQSPFAHFQMADKNEYWKPGFLTYSCPYSCYFELTKCTSWWLVEAEKHVIIHHSNYMHFLCTWPLAPCCFRAILISMPAPCIIYLLIMLYPNSCPSSGPRACQQAKLTPWGWVSLA